MLCRHGCCGCRCTFLIDPHRIGQSRGACSARLCGNGCCGGRCSSRNGRGSTDDLHGALIALACKKSRAATRKDMRLLNPVLAADAAGLFHQFVEVFNFKGRPFGDLSVARDATIVQHMFNGRVNAADPLQ